MTARKPTKQTGMTAPAAKPVALISDVRSLILQAREGVARAVDSTLTTLCLHVDLRVRRDVLKEKPADDGEQIVHALRALLAAEFGRGFAVRNLFNMIRFAEALSDEQIVSALRRQLTWTHFKLRVRIEAALNRDFYAEIWRLESAKG